jgi:hypothetical protein
MSNMTYCQPYEPTRQTAGMDAWGDNDPTLFCKCSNRSVIFVAASPKGRKVIFTTITSNAVNWNPV